MSSVLGYVAALAAIAALLAVLISNVDASGFDAITVVATVVFSSAAIGIGVVGSRDLRELGGVVVGRPTVDVPRLRSPRYLRSVGP